MILASATTLAFASRRIEAEDAAFAAAATGRCTPSTLNGSDVLPGTTIAVSPLPSSYDASYRTQISLLGVPPFDIAKLKVSGSASGGHSGRLRAYSQGDGASFVPDKPFFQGEVVTVSGVDRAGGRAQKFAFHFVTARENPLPGYTPSHYSGSYDQIDHFHSRPELDPPVVLVTARSGAAAPGLIFTAPYNGYGSTGPMIFDEAGNLVWFKALPFGTYSTNLQEQQLGGRPVLTWWQGNIPPQGFGEGEEMIYDSHYRQVGRVHAGNGLKADLHDFHLNANDTALLTVFNPIQCDLSWLGGPSGGAVTDSIFQEVDLRTGLVRREWHSLDHVGLSESYGSPVTTSTQWPFDFFHINSVDQTSAGTTLISARNTWAMYELSTLTGQVLNRFGGRRSTVKLASGANTAYQHDATVQANGTITVFDNGAVPTVHPQSRALVLSVDAQAHTLAVQSEFEHHPNALVSGSQGNVQTLANGDYFVGWGAEPYFSEFGPSGQLLFDAHMHGSYQAYRAYRFAWNGEPAEAPAIAASVSGSRVVVFASWNGDTRTASWRVLGGASAHSLTPVASATRTGFETAVAAPGSVRYVAVQALGGEGEVLGTSRTIAR